MITIYKKLSIILSLILAVVLLPQPVSAAETAAWDGSVAESFAGGTGTETDPYLIETPEQLAYLASLINQATSTRDPYRHAFYRLNADLDLNGTEWTPIGTGSAPKNFCGKFIGNGHTISNLKVNGEKYAGLFGNLADAIICDMTIENANVTSSSSGYAGALAASTGNSTLICNVHLRNSSVKAKYSGGILGEDGAGSSYRTTVKRSTVTNSEISTFTSGVAGGIVGSRISSGGSAVIEGCYTIGGSVTASNGTAGGIAGGTGSTTTISNSGPIYVSDCFNTANVTSSGMTGTQSLGAGGILGYNSNAYTTVDRCFNRGTVTIAQGSTQAPRYASGIIGYNIGASVSECFNAGMLQLSGSSSNKSATVLTTIDGYGNKAVYSYYLASSMPASLKNVTVKKTGTALNSEEELISQINACVQNHEIWTIRENDYPTLKRCCENETHSCSCGCYCGYHESEHHHVDEDGDGKCDECGKCLHHHDEDGYCTEENCTHGDDCCPKRGSEEDKKHNMPGMEKTADKETAAPGDTVTFTLTSNVPDYLYKYIDLSTGTIAPYEICFHDKMDASLIYQSDLRIMVGGTELANDLYSVEENCSDGCSFHVLMNLTDIYSAGGYFTYADLIHSPAITLTYSAKVKDGTVHGILTNTAHVDYEGKSSSDAVTKTNVYGIQIDKVETGTDARLKGAEFALYSDEDCTQFVASLVSDENGIAVAGGLKEGTYYLKETKAPSGYVRQTGSVRIELKDLQASENLYSYEFRNSRIPSAGGAGVMIFTVGGVLLIGAAFLLLFLSRRKKDDEEEADEA